MKIYQIIFIICLIINTCTSQSIQLTPSTQGTGVKLITTLFNEKVDEDPVLLSNSQDQTIFISNIFQDPVARRSLEIQFSEISETMFEIIQFKFTQYALVFFETKIVKIDMVPIFGPDSDKQNQVFQNSDLQIASIQQDSYVIKGISHVNDFDQIAIFIENNSGLVDLVVFLNAETMEFTDQIMSAQIPGSPEQQYLTCVNLFKYYSELEEKFIYLIALGEGFAKVSVRRLDNGNVIYNPQQLSIPGDNNDNSPITALLFMSNLAKLVASTQSGSLIIFDLKAIDGTADVELIDSEFGKFLPFKHIQPVIGTNFFITAGTNVGVRVYDAKSKQEITRVTSGHAIGKAAAFVRGTGYFAHQRHDDQYWQTQRQIVITKICSEDDEYLNFKYQECTNANCPSNLIYKGVCQDCGNKYYYQKLQCLEKECLANCSDICDQDGCGSGQTFVPPNSETGAACYCEIPPLTCNEGYYKAKDITGQSEECKQCPEQCPLCTSIDDKECQIKLEEKDDEGFPYPLAIIIGILILYTVVIVATIILKKSRDTKNGKTHLQQIAPQQNPGYQQVVNTQQGGSQSQEISSNQLPNSTGYGGTKTGFYPKSHIQKNMNQTQNAQFRNTQIAPQNQQQQHFRTTIQGHNRELQGIRQANNPPLANQYGVINEENNFYPAQQPNINVTPATQITRVTQKKPLPSSKLAPLNHSPVSQSPLSNHQNFATQINPMQRQQMQYQQQSQFGRTGYSQQSDQYYDNMGQQQLLNTQIQPPQQQQTRNFNTTIQRQQQPQQQQTRIQGQQQTNFRGTQGGQAWVSPQLVEQQQQQMTQIQQIRQQNQFQQQQMPMRSAVVNHNRNNNFMMSGDIVPDENFQQQQYQPPIQNYQQKQQTFVIEEQYDQQQPNYAEYDGQQQEEYYDDEASQQMKQLQQEQQKYGSDLPQDQFLNNYEQQQQSHLANQNNNTNNYLQGSPQHHDHVMTGNNEPEGQPLSQRFQNSNRGSDVDVNEL